MLFNKKKPATKAEIQLFDSITHLDDSVFDKERDSLIDRLPKVGIEGVFNCWHYSR